MTNEDFEIKKKALNESIEYFDSFVNKALASNIEGFTAIDLVKHYNVLRIELSKLYVK